MKRILFLIIRALKIPAIVRGLVQRRRVTILVYHDPSAETARQHFSVLKRIYNIIPLRDYIDARCSGTLDSLPSKALVITMDDGHAGNFLLRDVLRDMNIPVTIFLTSGIVGTSRHFWFKHKPGGIDNQALKTIPDSARLEKLAEIGYSDDAEFEDRQSLSAEEIEELKPWVNFQSHTVTHPLLPMCADAKAAHEIAQSKADLESRFGLDVYAMCYPNGDYSQRDIELCKAAGYKCGVTVDPGFNDASIDLFRLKRISINEEASLDQLLVTVCGVWPYLRNLVKKRRCGETEVTASE